MSFPTNQVVDHIRDNGDLIANVLEQIFGSEATIETDSIEVLSEKPDLSLYGLATWIVSDQTTLSVLIPTDIIPKEWDGLACAPADLPERLTTAVLPEDIAYKTAKLVAVGRVAGAVLPATVFIPLVSSISESPFVVAVGVDNPDAIPRVGQERLRDLPVQIVVNLATKKIDMSQLLAFGAGTLIAFEKPAEDYLDLYVNNHLHARGEAVKIGERFGLRLNQIGINDERVSPVIAPAMPGAGAARAG